MESQKQNSDYDPLRVSFASFLLKILAAGVGGAVGALILLLVFIFASSLLAPLTQGFDGEYVSPIFVFFLMVMIFVSTTVSNLLSPFLLYLTEREKYTRISSTLYQIFILSVIIFLLTVPLYFLAASIDIQVTGYAVALHIIISAQVSALILEVISNYKYSLLGIYGVTFAVVISSAVMFGLYNIVDNITIVLFAALPVVWLSIAFIQSIATMLYGWIARTYDKDFLAADTDYGDDYGKPYQPEENTTPKAKDEDGSEFLKHN